MFEDELETKFKAIFGVKKVSFDLPGESKEQECLFIKVDSARATIKEKRAKARVEGSAFMVAPSNKLPFGFFQKAIAKADPSLTKDLFFFEIEGNDQRYRNLVERGFSFIYLFDGQHDPGIGTIDSVSIEIDTEE